MRGLMNMLINERERLARILKIAEASASNAPEGRLRISKDRGQVRYYHCCTDRYGTYIPKKNEELPRQLAQKGYDSEIIKLVKTRLKQIEKMLDGFADDEIEWIYTKLNTDRRALITPVEPTFEQQMEEWYNKPYIGKNFQDGTIVILSEKGERVRSKSEKIIADWLYRNNINYLYEKPLFLQGYGTVYPDFTFLSSKTGEIIYWEHEGMLDKPEYARSAVRKLEMYEKNGIFPGEKLILTFETSEITINTELVRNLAERYLV